MAFAAFFSMYDSYLTMQPCVGVIFGILSGVVCACIFAVFVIYFQSNTIVVEIALNLTA